MKTTKKELDIFEKECFKWIDFWNLRNWRVYINLSDTGDSAATTTLNNSQHQVVIRLNKYHEEHWGWKKEDLKQYAFHEVCHILFAGLCEAAYERFVRQEEIDNEEHSLIRLFENVIFSSNQINTNK